MNRHTKKVHERIYSFMIKMFFFSKLGIEGYFINL